jgi:hypothetical protein
MSRSDSVRLVLAALCLCLPAAPQSGDARPFGGKYSGLAPEQKILVNRWVAEFKKISGKTVDPSEAYDHLSLSSRTTFEAVTHALIKSKLTSSKGQPMGRSIDLIDVVEWIAGNVPGTRGDHQFRIYVYLKPGAFEKLIEAKEFDRDRDNTVYHNGYPINFRQTGGTPSIQFSLARTGRRADVDVDYRSSAAYKALFNGHLSAANSDVRAGDNYKTHVGRWEGFTNWWQQLLASLGNDAAEASAGNATLASVVRTDLEEKAKGPVQDAIYAYLSSWLEKGDALSSLSAVSVKAYPCVAEFKDGSQPDSKLALFRILRQEQLTAKRLGKVTSLSAVVEPVDYPLPGAVVVDQSHSKLFTLQHVPDDVAWALDCRIRYRMEVAESIPKPSHKLGNTYAAAMKVKGSEPGVFLLQFWTRQGGRWELSSFDIKHSSKAPPDDVVARAVAWQSGASAESKPANAAQASDPQVQAAAVGLLTAWLMKKQPQQALGYFDPDAYACDAFASGDVPAAQRSGAQGRARLEQALAEVAKEAATAPTLEGIIRTPEAGHPGLKLVPHAHANAFFLARVSPDLAQMNSCTAKGPLAKASRKEMAAPSAGTSSYMTAFQSAAAEGDNPAVVILYWQRRGGEWKVTSYSVVND